MSEIKANVKDNRPLSFSDLLNLDGEPVWGVDSSEDMSLWFLVDVDRSHYDVWLIGTRGRDCVFYSDDDLLQANIALYRYRKLSD